MEIEALRKYQQLYLSAERMGAADILRAYLGVGSDEVVPISISHGVDFGHCYRAMDYEGLEPIHWAYNQKIIKRVKDYKPYIGLPHPWLLLEKMCAFEKAGGTLIIGPPPGPENDRNLLQRLQSIQLKNATILVKSRGNHEGSIDFWKKHGLKTITLGARDSSFYRRLFQLISSFENIVACTFSSAVIFGSSIGKKIEFIKDYTYSFYDRGDYLEIVNFNSPDARAFVRDFFSAGDRERQKLARDVLGDDFLIEPQKILEKISLSVEQLSFPVFKNCGSGSGMRLMFSVLFRQPRIINLDFSEKLSTAFLGSKKLMVSGVWMNEIDIWLNGLNERNFKISRMQYRKNQTIPGRAIEQY